MAQYKTYALTLTPEQIGWLKKTSKDFRAPTTEFVRMAFDYLRESDAKELKTRMQKSRLEAELQEASQKAEAYAKKKEKIESELEALSV